MKRMVERLAESLGAQALVNAVWLYLDQAVRAVVVLVAFGAVARHLGPEGFGVLSYAVAFAGLFVPLAVLGLDYVIVMELVRNRANERVILATTFRLKLLVAGGAFALSLGVMGFVPVDPSVLPLLMVAALSLLSQPFMVLDYWFQSHVASRYSVAARLGACIVANGLRLGFVLLEAPLAWFVWLFAVEAFLFGLGLFGAFRLADAPRMSGWLGLYDKALVRRLWRQAWPLFLADIAIVGYLRADQMLLSHFAGSAQLGRYAAAFRLADAAEFFVLALVNSYFPRLVALHGGERKLFEAGLAGFLTGLTWFAVTMAVAVSVASPWIVRLVLGPEFAGSESVLIVLAWANVFVTLIAVRGKWFLLDGLQAWSLLLFASGAVMHLTGVVLLAGRWGAPGAAYSFLLAQAGMAVGVPLLFRPTRRAAFLALRSFWPRRS